MIVESARLGDLEIEEKDIIAFPKGLLGFEEERRFLLLPYEPESPFFLLQSVADKNLMFLLADVFSFFADYEFVLDDQLVAELELSEEYRPHVLAIVNVPKNAADMTANLLAPLIFNIDRRLAQQVVLEKTVYKTKHRLFAPPAPEKAQGGE
ncbi:hypothetical protein P22_0501 [Propionispora sp. 2/2-37]|uniref:flagellar assembly protein FliW n=1 Tax=Propionispora sp. 2/2-37 TaxID=1677858 RepID=UPI0006BB7CFB|nr:flagellar assembly protein FliW [Propionispora sp. 2/2-37]CUH94435.1 hypothetical protein P22_0501 [Propionispora sp. 2/2-37]